MRYFLELSYLGTKYNGWQRQTNASSIQQTLEQAVGMILRENIALTGAGRTDAGVHAAYYVAHFDCNIEIGDCTSLCYHLNALLPEDIAVQSITSVNQDAHARFGAKQREYKYYISPVKNPFNRHLTWQYYAPLDIEAMNCAAKILFQIEDFTSFAKLNSDNKTNLCSVTTAQWCNENGLLVFTIRADRFLRNMVRAVTGTLVDVGRGKITIADFERIATAKDLSLASGSAPASGLFLSDIVYPTEMFIRSKG